MTSRSAHYALVQEGPPLQLLVEEEDESRINLREELSSIYASYAELYPNPSLTDEYLERDRLLQGVKSALIAKHARPVEETKTRKGGFFGALFGAKRENIAPPPEPEMDEEDYLVYTHFPQDESDHDQDLCGTSNALQLDCIPEEAHAMARFHLCSRHRGSPVIVKDSPRPLLIIGLGIIAEHNGQQWLLCETSDKSYLHEYIPTLETPFSLIHSRAVAVGENFMAVSWGLGDGIVVLYRRASGFGKADWQAFSCALPTRAVLENLQASGDVFLQHPDGSLSSQSLRVTDMCTLVVGLGQGEAAVTLALSRLGAYMELIPLPMAVWLGPVLTPKSHTHQKRSKTKRGVVPHYALGHNYNICAHLSVAALTTGERHSDILALEAFRTTVRPDMEWDEALYPGAPPAEYVLAATGTGNGVEVITFWAVSAIFSENHEEGFSLHVVLSDTLQIGKVGGDVSLFGTDEITQHWRRPRYVELRPMDQVERILNGTEKRPSKPTKLSTLSVTAPIVSLRFCIKDGSVVLAILDFNGGVTLVDCTQLVLFVSQLLSVEQLEELDRDQVPFTLITMGRAEISKYTSGPVVDANWMPSEGLVATSLIGTLQILNVDESKVTSNIGIPTTSRGSKIFGTYPDHVSILMKRGKGLSLCAIQKLDPITIIQRLAQAGKFKEAIAASLGVHNNLAISDVVEECHKKLWEADHAVENLANVTDDSFILEQVVGLFEHTGKEVNRVEFDVALQACSMALKRLKKTRFATALQIGGADGVAGAILKLTNIFIKLGTFSLLCKVYESKPDLERFRGSFLTLSFVDLATSIATKGDIFALTIVMYRHRHELRPFQLKILSQIPLALDPVTYCHLLPVDRPEGDFFVVNDEQKGGRPWSSMNVYINQTANQTLVNSEEDANYVSSTLADALDEISSSRKEMTNWHLDRALQLEASVGKLDLLETFCSLALKSLLVTGKPDNADDPSIARLYSLRVVASCLNDLALGGNNTVGLCDPDFNSVAAVTASEILEMPFDKLFATLLGSPKDPIDVFSRFKAVVQPIITLPGLSASSDCRSQDEIEESSDCAIVAYCLGQVNASTNKPLGKMASSTSQIIVLRNALSICSTVANSSRSSIKKQDRLVKRKKNVTDLVVQVVYCLSVITVDLVLLPSDCRHIVGLLWDMYECLPNQCPVDEKEDNFASLSSRADLLYRHLIAVDLMSRWVPQKALTFAGKLKHASERDGMELVGNELASLMCQTFCKQLKKDEGADWNDQSFISLREIVSDLEEINAACFDSSLDFLEVVQNELIKSLLKHGQFRLMNKLLSKKSPWMNKNAVERAIVAFVNEAMFGDEITSTAANGVNLQLAIRCQDVVGPMFPSLHQSFWSMRKYLDAAHFANSVLLREMRGFEIKPTDVRDAPPLDIVEKVLQANPRAILEGCPDWMDSIFARGANAAMLLFFRTRSNPNLAMESQHHDKPQLPPLPGGAIFHLAFLVGLERQTASIVVKTRVANIGFSMGAPWIAAAICLSLVHDFEGELASAEASLLLGLVAQVVTDDAYDDIYTKKSLCEGVLSQMKNSVSVSDSKAFASICGAFASLESRTSRFRPEAWVQTHAKDEQTDQSIDQGSAFLAFRAAAAVVNLVGHLDDETCPSKPKGLEPRPIDRVYKETMAGYNANIHELFTILQLKASSNDHDDPLLIAIGRLMTFWAVAVSSRFTSENLDGTREQADAADVLQICASLFFHVNHKEGLISDIVELRQIAETQAAGALEQASLFSKPTSVRPDLGIVRTLVGRGYTENGARRAAVMTNNASADLALQWAVAHSFEPGFDDPIILIKSIREKNLDQKSIKMIKEVLFLVSQLAEGETTIKSLLPRLKRDSSLLSDASRPRMTGSSMKSIIPQTKAVEHGKADATSRDWSLGETHLELQPKTKSQSIVMPKQQVRSTFVEPLPAPAPKLADPASTKKLIVPVVRRAAPLLPRTPARITNPQPKNLMVSIAEQHSQSKRLVVPAPAHTHQPKKVVAAAAQPAAVEIVSIPETLPKPSSVPAPVPTMLAPQIMTTQGSTKSEETKQQELTLSSLPQPMGSPFPRSPPPKPPSRPRPPPAPLSGDRSILRQVGERARLQATAASAKLGSEERMRLVMKGRKLLERSRESGLTPDALKASTASVRESIASRLRSSSSTASKGTAIPPPPAPPPKPVAVPQEEKPEEEADIEVDDGGSGWEFDV